MFILGVAIGYIITAMLIAGALLTDKRTNRNFKEACYCIATGASWPISVPILAGILFYMNVVEEINEKRNAQTERLGEFTEVLHKIGIIGNLTKIYISANLGKRYK